jgi:putative aldouronate transport system permease protein
MNANLSEHAYTQVERRRFQFKDKYKLFLMAFPFLALVFLFSYLPLYGWVYAFYDYRPGIPLSKTEFMSLHWFTTMVSNQIQRQEIVRVLRNTFAISSLGILSSVLPVIFAIFLTEIKNSTFKKMVQTITTLPNFISWVLVYAFASPSRSSSIDSFYPFSSSVVQRWSCAAWTANENVSEIEQTAAAFCFVR